MNLSTAMGGAVAVVLSLGVLLAEPAGTLDAAFQAANHQVAEGRFAEGAAAYARLPVTNRTSVALEYNRGIAHAHAGEPGRARAHWLQAERLAPRNPAVQTALNQSLARLPPDPVDVVGGPLAWTDRLSLNEWGVLACVLSWTWGILLLAGRASPALAVGLRGYTLGAGVLAVLAAALVAGAWARRARLPDAVVLNPDTMVRVSPLDEARTAFTVAEGGRLRSQEARAGWLLVEDPGTHRFGWVKRNEVLRLPLR